MAAMHLRRPTLRTAALLSLAATCGAVAVDVYRPVAAQSGPVTIYRCTDDAGRLTLRDTPCRRGQQQESREMQRPQDPPPRPAPLPVATTVVAPPPAPPQRVVVTPPRPMYECVTPDGERYTSDTDQGDPRWVPLWTVGYPVVIGERPGRRVGAPRPRPPGDRPRPPDRWPHPGAVVYPGAGTWVRDVCHPLPQADVCDRLREERAGIASRYNSALQSERRVINTERRRLDARLANDCGG